MPHRRAYGNGSDDEGKGNAMTGFDGWDWPAADAERMTEAMFDENARLRGLDPRHKDDGTVALTAGGADRGGEAGRAWRLEPSRRRPGRSGRACGRRRGPARPCRPADRRRAPRPAALRLEGRIPGPASDPLHGTGCGAVFAIPEEDRPVFCQYWKKPGGMHRYACGMHQATHTFDPMKTLGNKGIREDKDKGMHCMHLFSELLSFTPFSLIGHAYHAYGCIPPSVIGGIMPKMGVRTVCIT